MRDGDIAIWNASFAEHGWMCVEVHRHDSNGWLARCWRKDERTVGPWRRDAIKEASDALAKHMQKAT